MLLVGTTSRGETDLSRAKRERAVTVTGTPAEPLPEIHVAQDTLTFLWFPTLILKKTLSVDESRIRVLDVGERSIVVQAAGDYRAGERHELAVFFADGQAPARAAFVLVMDPAEVDSRIDVQRPEPPRTPCPAEVQRAAPLPEDFVLKGYVNDHGIQTAVIDPVVDSAQGLSTGRGVSYRGNEWVLFDVEIDNLSGRPLFAPRDATLTGKGGVTLRARLVTAAVDEPSAGGTVRVLVVAETPPPSAGLVFTVEVRGADGRSLVIPRAHLPRPVAEGTP
jgi:uncharacterized protein (TIGR02268 family)